MNGSFSLLQYFLCCFAGPFALCYSSLSLVAACSSLYSSSSVSFSSSLEVAVEESNETWFKYDKIKQLCKKKHIGEQIHGSVPLFEAGSVNELGVRQNRNYLSHWCCESKQVIHSNCTRAHFIHMPYCQSLVVCVYITWFPGQTQRSCRQCSNLCPAALWPAFPTALPALSDSKWSEIKSTEGT